MKNCDPTKHEVGRTNALDVIGQVPGKCESRRLRGRLWLTEIELQADSAISDEDGLAPTSELASAEGYSADPDYAARSYLGPYGIPLRSLIAADVAAAAAQSAPHLGIAHRPRPRREYPGAGT